MGVPRQGADRIPEADAQLPQGIGEAFRTGLDAGVGVAVKIPFDRSGDDLGVAVIFRREVDEGRYQQRAVHYQSEHWRSVRYCGELRKPYLLGTPLKRTAGYP